MQHCCSLMMSVITADMDLQTLEKKLTDDKDKAFQAWINSRMHGQGYKELCCKEAWEKAEARCSDFYRQMGPALAHMPGGEHARGRAALCPALPPCLVNAMKCALFILSSPASHGAWPISMRPFPAGL